ncbi:MAG: hypothetical protein ACLQPD_15910 [Desulfomonilaceae bacterium]
MRRNIIIFVFVAVTLAALLPAHVFAKDTASKALLDRTLMGFKEQGVWYFLCIAPEHPSRISPNYQTYGPPAPPCPPPPCLVPVKPTKFRKAPPH